MLINCPECELQVSDKALSCPHCGYPLKSEARTYTRRKRRSLPNGFGQISEIKNKPLQNPFRAMVPIGKKPNGRPQLKIVGYYKTYNDAYNALSEYHKNPYDLDNDMTVHDLYEQWSKIYFKTLKSVSSERTITSAWRYCDSIKNIKVRELRARHIKSCIDEGMYNGKKASPNIKSRVKSLFNIMLDYALEYEIVDRNYARTFSNNIDTPNTKGHIPYTQQEIDLLWENINIPYVDVILLQCYSGLRPQEIGQLKLENIKGDYMIGGMKTKAGTDRIIPIHEKIKEIVINKKKEAIEIGSEYLINCTDTVSHKSSNMFTYDKYRHRFDKIKKRLNLNPEHRCHDGRMHFITQAKKYNVDEYAIKYIVGHAINDITEKIYTEREIEWLIEEMDKIK